jgi:DNA-binding transcriptional regulator YdaS (Cro superfamily)
MESKTPHESLIEAVAILGSQAAMSDVCGVTQAAVWKWLNKKKLLPAEHVLKVEAATGVSRHRLRPDLYPDESGAGTAALDHATPAPADEARA